MERMLEDYWLLTRLCGVLGFSSRRLRGKGRLRSLEFVSWEAMLVHVGATLANGPV